MSSSGLFQAFRVNGGPTYYPALHTPVEADILVAGLIFAFIIITASFFAILPGIRGWEVNALFLHLHEIVEGLYFHCSLSVCVCVCVCVRLCL